MTTNKNYNPRLHIIFHSCTERELQFATKKIPGKQSLLQWADTKLYDPIFIVKPNNQHPQLGGYLFTIENEYHDKNWLNVEGLPINNT